MTPVAARQNINWRPLLALAVIASTVAVIALVNHARRRPATFGVRQACSILTPTVARSVGGNKLVPQTIKTTSTAATTTTFCVYRGASSSLALIVRSPKNQAGTDLNKTAFSKPLSGSQTVHGYGDAAYWSPSFAQLNILDHNNWYILSNGPNTPSQRTLGGAEQLANKILDRL